MFCCKLNEANTLYIHYTINIYQSRFVSLQTGWSERSIINGRRDLSHQWNRATDLACQVTSLPCFFCGQCFSLSSQVFQNCKQLRFAAECKKRWNMNKAEIEDFWLECLNDTTVPKSSWPALGNCSHLPFTTQNKMCFYVSFSQLNWFVFFPGNKPSGTKVLMNVVSRLWQSSRNWVSEVVANCLTIGAWLRAKCRNVMNLIFTRWKNDTGHCFRCFVCWCMLFYHCLQRLKVQ